MAGMDKWAQGTRESDKVDDRRSPLRRAEDNIDDVAERGRIRADAEDWGAALEAKPIRKPTITQRIDGDVLLGRLAAAEESTPAMRTKRFLDKNKPSKKELDDLLAVANQGPDVWPPGQAPTDVLKPITSWMPEKGEDYGPPMPQYGPEYKPKRLMDGDIYFPNADKFHPDLW